MAIYSCTLGVVSRSKGKQVCAAAAYQARERIRDERQGRLFRYRDREGEILLAAEIIMPAAAPQWDRPTLWNMAERAERRKDAQTARTIRLALPRELTHRQMLRLVRRFLKKQFVDRGLAVDFALHDKLASDGARQPHAHVLVTLRQITARGLSAKKDRETFRNSVCVTAFRKAWADAVNAALAAANIDATIDHRSLADQREAVETLLLDPGLERKDRYGLEALRISLLREPEKKSPIREWQAARRRNTIPREVALARNAAREALEVADELLDLIEDLDVQRQLQPAADAPRLDFATDYDDDLGDSPLGPDVEVEVERTPELDVPDTTPAPRPW